MTEAEVETIIQRARERFPNARPRIISDNGPHFIAKDFKESIRICGMTHVRTSPWYPHTTRAPTQGPRPKGGRHDAALISPCGIGTKSENRGIALRCSLYLIFRTQFLYFTVNHHTQRRDVPEHEAPPQANSPMAARALSVKLAGIPTRS
jgi:hypothetical protein